MEVVFCPPEGDGQCGAAHEWVVTYYWTGKHVACGGKFSPNGLTAAHRSLPCGTRLRVRNPNNGNLLWLRSMTAGRLSKVLALILREVRLAHWA